MDVFNSNGTVSVRAYKGDAMTLLAIDLDASKTKNFTGFSIFVTPPGKTGYFLFNRISYGPNILKKNKLDAKAKVTMDIAPLQIFRWVHTPGTNHNINDPIFGTYTYRVTPRYMIDDILQPLDKTLTVEVSIDVNPYKNGKLQIGFTRGFIESQAFTRHFGLNNAIRPNKTDLLFDITQNAGPRAQDKKKFPDLKPYTYEFMHQWLGWQARVLVLDFLQEAQKAGNTLDVFAFDLNEPEVCDTCLKMGKSGKIRIILDNSADHTGKTKLETAFDKQYRDAAKDPDSLLRGRFGALAHTKVFILKTNGKAVKVLTGSTNFSTNGLYINANHVLVFNEPSIAQLYEDVFEGSFTAMKSFSGSDFAKQQGFDFSVSGVPKCKIRFSPHSSAAATAFFKTINQRIVSAKSDVLFAIMNDSSQSSILSAIQQQIKNPKVFTYGITDIIKKKDKTQAMLYKPNSIRGTRVAGKPGEFILPPPFTAEAGIPGISVHHKFVVVDFKGTDPTVYCGSSNLAFGPEQKNGDNLIEIRDKDVATVFAIEAIRLVDHFQFIDAQAKLGPKAGKKDFNLHDSSEATWFKAYYDKKDLKCVERTLLIK